MRRDARQPENEAWRGLLLAALEDSAFSTLQPDPDWFRIPSHVHGIAHEMRVLLHAEILGRWLGVPTATLRLAAIVHDTQRTHDGVEPRHGPAAAAWLNAHRRTFARLLPDADLDLAIQVVHDHSLPDHRAQARSLTWAIFKDADALDRWRIADLDPSYLRLAESHHLLAFSQSLFASTARGPRIVEIPGHVRAVAKSLAEDSASP